MIFVLQYSMKLKSKYDTQRRSAIARGIEWHFTYDTWVAWWGDDIDRRGRLTGQLVMARNNDSGPYHPDNVSKKTCNENSSEGSKGIPAPQKACPGEKNGMFGKVSAMRGKKQTALGLSSIIDRARSDNNTMVRTVLTCPHCQTITNKGNAKRWHMDRCRLRTFDPS